MKTNYLLLLVMTLLSTISFSQNPNPKDYYFEFDDTLRIFDSRDIILDTVDYNTFKEYRKIEIIEVDKNGKEKVLPVVDGKIFVIGVSTINPIDSTGTILIPKYSSRTVLHMINGRTANIFVTCLSKDGRRITLGLTVYGKE